MVRRATANLIESILRVHADEIAPEIDLATAATIIQTVLEAIVHRIKLARPAHTRDDALARDTTRLITRYLTPST